MASDQVKIRMGRLSHLLIVFFMITERFGLEGGTLKLHSSRLGLSADKPSVQFIQLWFSGLYGREVLNLS